MKVRNFLFHRVSTDIDRLWPPMSPKHFERIISYMMKNYEVVELENYLAEGLKYIPQKPVATVLFDDGYKDNIEFAAPILKKYKCPATFYIVTDCIDHNRPTWTYILDHRFQNTRKNSMKLPFVVEGMAMEPQWSNGAERIEYARQLKPKLKKMGHTGRAQVLSAVDEHFDDVAVPRIMMNWDDIRKLKKDGFGIGSHTKTHTLLASVGDDDVLKRELQQPIERFAQELDDIPYTISYPIGSYDKRVMRMSEKVGYKIGLAVDERFYDTGKDDLFSIPRVELYEESWTKTRLRMNGAVNGLKRILK